MGSFSFLFTVYSAQIILVSIVLPNLAASRIKRSMELDRTTSQLMQSYMVLNGFIVILGLVTLTLLYHLHLHSAYLLMSLLIGAFLCAQFLPLDITELCPVAWRAHGSKMHSASSSNQHVEFAESIRLAVFVGIGSYGLARMLFASYDVDTFRPVAMSIGCQVAAVFLYSIYVLKGEIQETKP